MVLTELPAVLTQCIRYVGVSKAMPAPDLLAAAALRASESALAGCMAQAQPYPTAVSVFTYLCEYRHDSSWRVNASAAAGLADVLDRARRAPCMAQGVRGSGREAMRSSADAVFAQAVEKNSATALAHLIRDANYM